MKQWTVAVLVIMPAAFLFFVPIVPIADFACFGAIGCPFHTVWTPARVSVTAYLTGSGGEIVGKPYYNAITYQIMLASCHKTASGEDCGGLTVVSVPLNFASVRGVVP